MAPEPDKVSKSYKISIPRAWKLPLITRLYLRLEEAMNPSREHADRVQFFVDENLPVDPEITETLETVFAAIPPWVKKVFCIGKIYIPFCHPYFHYTEGIPCLGTSRRINFRDMRYASAGLLEDEAQEVMKVDGSDVEEYRRRIAIAEQNPVISEETDLLEMEKVAEYQNGLNRRTIVRYLVPNLQRWITVEVC
ncbi:hypothetical protein BU23DRAFT_598191 [Bimuria novae-zelandiae CBS 107.79]|uniref:Uncharacterized protein n=1 Tax=Bimuria novae-zelandiae CBS 107.79 TaxID=1447943 RepID=A0A6A5VDM6_9PLEO|nr:hypothetical protein BU23DRAFT_598191 [Bimuria novae-zelandiae CBS 107.79]